MKGELRLDLYLFGKDIDLDLRLYDLKAPAARAACR